jgi:hypothetical protein
VRQINHKVTVRPAYYPPYHSKHTPIERGWGILENHRNSSLLDAMDAGLQCAATMTWKGLHPVVPLVTTNLSDRRHLRPKTPWKRWKPSAHAYPPEKVVCGCCLFLSIRDT